MVPEYASWDIAAAADGDHEVWLKVIEDTLGGSLTKLMHLGYWEVSYVFP